MLPASRRQAESRQKASRVHVGNKQVASRMPAGCRQQAATRRAGGEAEGVRSRQRNKACKHTMYHVLQWFLKAVLLSMPVIPLRALSEPEQTASKQVELPLLHDPSQTALADSKVCW
jgi:hypothetical protein